MNTVQSTCSNYSWSLSHIRIVTLLHLYADVVDDAWCIVHYNDITV